MNLDEEIRIGGRIAIMKDGMIMGMGGGRKTLLWGTLFEWAAPSGGTAPLN